MQILEIKNNLVKISYDVRENVTLSSFLIIEDENMPYVGQIMSLKADNDVNYAMVKLLFTFDDEGILKSYNGSIPSLKSAISKLSAQELLEILPINEPVILGKLSNEEFVLNVDKSIFESNLLICSNSQNNNEIIVNNFLTQFEKSGQKAVVLDPEGGFEWYNKLVLGEDFKLPLNYETINFIYENDLEDVDAMSKAIIQEIFLEVQEYSRSIPEGFIPFNTFINVVEQQYKETGIVELVLLKNKLLKYRDANIFAQNLAEINTLKLGIEKSNTIVCDLSNVDSLLQREAMFHIYNVMEQSDDNIYSFVNVDNNNVSKKLLKEFLNNSNISTTVICGHEFKYLHELKQTAGNLILFAPLTSQHDFADYNAFLNKLTPNEYIVYGAHTQNIPFLVVLEDFETIEENISRISMLNEEVTIVEEPSVSEEISFVEEFENSESIHEEDFVDEEVILEKVDEMYYNPKAPTPSIDNIDEEEIVVGEQEYMDSSADFLDEVETIIESDEELSPVIEATNTDDIEIIEEPVTDALISNDAEFLEEIEQDIPSFTDKDAAVEAFDETPIDIATDETDEVSEFSAFDAESDFQEEPVVDQKFIGDDEFTGDDEFAQDEEFSQEEEQEEIEIVEEPTPMVPIYPANDIDNRNTPVFEQGDAVSHPKYGQGVVEKMIKYGNKTLCSINFENIGRRLLDPAISEITKL